MSFLEGIEIGSDLITDITYRSPRGNVQRKNWTARHTEVVMLSLRGKSFKEIADTTGYSEGSIASIIRTPQAQEIRLEVSKLAFESRIDETVSAYTQIKAKAVENIREFVVDRDDVRKKSNPFGFFDRMVTVTKLVDEIEGPKIAPAPIQSTQVNNTQVNNVFMTPEGQKDLTEGLNKAMEVAQIHQKLLGESYGNVKSLKND